MTTPTDLDTYLFDLRGYLLRKGGLTSGEVADCNAILDTLLDTKPGEWHGYRPSRELLGRLTPERRQIVWPHRTIEGAPYGREK